MMGATEIETGSKVGKAPGKAEEAFALNLVALRTCLAGMELKDLTYRWSLESDERKRAYRFVEHMISKQRKGNLSEGHLRKVIELDFSYNGKPIREVMTVDVSERSTEGLLLSYATRRAKEATEAAEKAEREAVLRIAAARQEIADAQAMVDEARHRAEAAVQQADEVHRQLLIDLRELRLAKLQLGGQPVYTYLTTDELAPRLRYDPRTIREGMQSIMTEGVHYVRGPGGRKLLWIWENIESDMLAGVFALANREIDDGSGSAEDHVG